MDIWTRLLSPQRVKLDADGRVSFEDYRRKDDTRSPFEVDYSRVVFSSSFRRLARKTQVHPFADVDHIHNRLTHSLEVASLCHTFAREITAFLQARGDLRHSIYYRFTLASLGALVKHPRLASSFSAATPGARKLAAFSTEEEIFRAVWTQLGLVRADGSFMRHPLSYLTEAADDICYRILDFEDAVAMGILPEAQVRALFYEMLTPRHQAESDGQPLQWLRGVAIRDLVEAFVEQFKWHYADILSGAFEGELKDGLEAGPRAAFEEIRSLYGVLFSHHRKVIAEIGSYGQFSGVLDHYLGFLEQIPSKGEAPAFTALPAFCRQLVLLAWDADYYTAHRARSRAWWAHAVLDFVSGMTDDYLNALAHRLGC